MSQDKQKMIQMKSCMISMQFCYTFSLTNFIREYTKMAILL